MEPFTNPLPHTWSEEQALEVAVPGLIAHLDGASDGESHGQQSQTPIPQQQPFDSSASSHMAPPGIAEQARVPILNDDLPEHMQLDTRNSLPIVQEAQMTDGQQYDNTMQHFPSQAINSQTSGPVSKNLNPVNLVHMPSIPLAATRETEVKQELATDYHDVFAAFTNEASHEEENAETEQGSNDVSGAVDRVPIPASIKLEPDIGSQVNPRRAKTVNFAVGSNHDIPKVHAAAPLPEFLSRNDNFHSGAHLAETEAFPKRIRPVTPEPHEIGTRVRFTQSESPSMAAARDDTTQINFEQWVQASIQQSIDYQASPLPDGRQRLMGPVEQSQQHGTTRAASSLSEMALMPVNDDRSAQLWQQRVQLLNTNPAFAEQIHRMVHGPLPQFDHVKGQHITGSSNFTGPSGPSNLQSSNPSQRFSTSQPRVSTSYNGHLPHQPLSSHLPHAHPLAQRIPSDHGASLQMSNPNWPTGYPFTSAGPIDPHNTQVHEEDVEMSDQSQALTIDKGSGDLDISADSVIGGRDDLKDASDNDASNAEPISWKLPSFEITYHGPEKPNDNHEAAVSIPNLVREHVVLTDDHHRQEMQLFLEVFLPAQRALQTPDPQPAHSVINFHTISVMVLEAFVQWEIGDELGRGYGFHGGNTAMRPPPQGKEDDEPERIRSATDADVDEIFFSVVDRWRAGMLSDKGTFKLIRGCQEFCDIALDVIHFVKEHGLLSPEEKKKKKERSDKGSVRVPKGGAQEDSEGNVNNVPSRKKPKTEDKKGKKPVAKPKKKQKGTVEVVRNVRKK